MNDSLFWQITPEQQARMDRSEARVRSLRERAEVIWLSPDSKDAPGTVNCARCARIGGFNPERQGGFCLLLRRMVSTWHPVSCQAFKVPA